jgi:hypothetical protein
VGWVIGRTIVVDMRRRHAGPFVAAFSIPGSYASRDGILDSLARRYAFGVLQSGTSAKVDLVPFPTDPQSRATFARRQRLVYDEFAGKSADLSTAEDTIIAKVHAHQEPDSEIHSLDARGILVAQGDRLDLQDSHRLALAAGVQGIWQTLQQTTHEERGD